MYEPWSQLHANLMFHAARYCLHRFAKVELSRRSRKASHRAAFTTFKKEKKDPGESVVEGEDCPELVIVAESALFLLFADGYFPSLSRSFGEETSAAWLHDLQTLVCRVWHSATHSGHPPIQVIGEMFKHLCDDPIHDYQACSRVTLAQGRCCFCSPDQCIGLGVI